MQKKGFVEEAHPLLYFFLNILGYNFCSRDETDRYQNNYRSYPVAVILNSILICFVVYESILIFSTTEYEMILAIGSHVISCIYLFFSSCDALKNRTTKMKYLNTIGPNFTKPVKNIQRAMSYSVLTIYSVFLVVICSLVMDIEFMIMLLRAWIPFMFILPAMLDYQYKILADSLIQSHRLLIQNISHLVKTKTISSSHNEESIDTICNQLYDGNNYKNNCNINQFEHLNFTVHNEVLQRAIEYRVRKVSKLADLFNKVLCNTNYISI